MNKSEYILLKKDTFKIKNNKLILIGNDRRKNK